MPFQTSKGRNSWPPLDLRLNGGRRCHIALGRLSSKKRLQLVVAE